VKLLETLLEEALERGASDVHIVSGLRPVLRINTVLEVLEDYPVIDPEKAEQYVKELVGPERFEKLLRQRDLDFSMSLKGKARFRVNAHYQRDSIALAMRKLNQPIPTIESLNLPFILDKFVDLPRGLVLVTGVTGSGKSTTLAAMIQAMNERHHHHILMLEDPIEYIIPSQNCIIEQRELGSDVPTFASGLRHALRQDPDIILVGEMRDLETTSAAITAAETGHLVLSTLHTQNAAQTVERIIDIYPAGQQNQIRAMLANTLQAVVSQVLFKRIDQPGMIPACEIMVCTPAVRNCIRENRVHEIPNIIETSRSAGMCTLDDSIKALYLNGQITYQDAISRAVNPEALGKAVAAFRG